MTATTAPAFQPMADRFPDSISADEFFNGPDSFIEDEDGSHAYALMLERRAENGSWFGR